jgi:hypothetical protein
MSYIDVDYATSPQSYDEAAAQDMTKYDVNITWRGRDAMTGHPTVRVSGDKSAVEAFLIGEGYADPEIYTISEEAAV